MTKALKFTAILISVFSLRLLATGDLSDIKSETLKRIQVPQADFKPDNPPATQNDAIAIYAAAEEYTFKTEAEKAAQERLSILKKYGITVLGSNIVEKGNDYSFTVEYLPVLKNPNTISPVLIETYSSPKTYWNQTLAKDALKTALSNFGNSPLKALDSGLSEKNGYSFNITYTVANQLRRQPSYTAVFEKSIYGNYTFENQAIKNISAALAAFTKAGLSPVTARPVQNDGNYSLEVEYMRKTDGGSERPEYSVDAYSCPEKFNFENEALKEGIYRSLSLPKMGISPLHVYALETGNDWSFSIDYAVKNFYFREEIIKEFSVKTYSNPAFFDFENQAEKAMEEKKAAFNAAGLYVLSSQTFTAGGNYSFRLEYLEKQTAPAPVHH